MSKTKRSYLSVLFAVISLVLASSTSAFSQENTQANLATNVNIKNFGQMDERFFRGGQPKEDDYKQLAELGIKTVIDLRDDPKPYEKQNVKTLGMRYVN